ncbi:MAG: response regulator [Candidatus Glassbacteria bacterium]
MEQAGTRKRVLWVDDEVDLLMAHVIFLEEKGFSVTTATNGEDALTLMRQENFDLVLLDEQMTGMRGITVLKELKFEFPHIPVVMVTKSEEEEVMNQAIGRKVDDYIVKPFNPPQLLSVCKRFLEGERISQQRLVQDFVISFRELQELIGTDLSWKDWAELYLRIIRWEMNLIEMEETGLLDSISDLKKEFRNRFSQYVARSYKRWIETGVDRPVLSTDLVSKYIYPTFASQGRVLFIIIDCLRLDQWESLLPEIAQLFDVRTELYYSILPSATPYARNSIFSGLMPLEIYKRHPDYWDLDADDEVSLNRFEKELFLEQLKNLGHDNPKLVRFERVLTKTDGQTLAKKMPSLLKSDLVTVVYNFIDILTHGRSESEILLEMVPDEEAMRSMAKTWFLHSNLYDLIKLAAREEMPVIVTSDHGSVHCFHPVIVHARRDASTNLRYKFGENLRAEGKEVYSEKKPASIGLTTKGVNVNFLFAMEDSYFVYPTKLREYQNRYYGSFLHGGISPEEIILPISLLTPRG